MVLAALISFGILLVAWIASPSDEPRREVVTQSTDVDINTAEGLVRAA